MKSITTNTRLEALFKRPEPINGIALPTVRNLRETGLIGDQFGAVLTAGPEESEVRFGFDNHRVWSFDDIDSPPYGPSLYQVEEMLFWGAAQDDLLVHCHAGMSRSTATAWGISIVRGADPREAFLGLLEAHPAEYDGSGRRWFCPNRLLVEHIQTVLGDSTLLDIRHELLRGDHRVSHWL
jgi:hypothetical protein